MNVGVDITLDRSVSSGINLCPKNRVRFNRISVPSGDGNRALFRGMGCE